MRAFPEGPHGAKNEPGLVHEVLSLDAPLPSGRYWERSGGHRHRGGHPRRGGRGGRSGGGFGLNDDRHDLKHKLVKLGDTTDRLLLPVMDVTRIVDAFVASDFFSWEQPHLELSTEDEVLKAEDLSIQDLLRRTVLNNPTRPAVSDSAYFIGVLVDCILQLPHKHSYYSTMLLLLLQEALKMAGGDLGRVLNIAYGSSGVMKGETVAVKGEIIHEDEGSPVETLGGDVKGETKRDIKTAAKSEQMDTDGGEEDTPRISRNLVKKVLYFLNLVGVLLARLQESMENIWNKKGGLHESGRLINGLRFVCDLCNLSIVDPAQVLSMMLTKLDECIHIVNKSDAVEHRALAEYVALVITRSAFWLHKDIYSQHKADFDALKSKLQVIADRCNPLSSREYIVAHPIASINMDADFADTPDAVINEIRHALMCFAAYQDRGWTSKVIPRLYDTPRLADLRNKPLNILAPFKLDLTLASEQWMNFIYDETFIPQSVLSSAMSDLPAPAPVPLYQPPPVCLKWRESPRTYHSLSLFDKAAMTELLSVEPLNIADAWIVKSYVRTTIQSFFEEPDFCAEALLYIPVKHDQFTIVLIETVIEICLQAPNGPLPSKSSQRQSATFLTQLLHRLCVLEKSLIPIVVKGFVGLLDQAATWDEWAFNQMVHFVAQWLTYHDTYATEVMRAVLSHDHLKAFIPRKDELAAQSMKDEKPQDVKPEFADKYIARIRTPFAEVGFLQTSQLRFMSNVVERMYRVLYLDTFQRKVPDVLTYFIPPRIPFEEHCLYVDLHDQDVRARDDIVKMQSLRLLDLPPLESFIIRYMMKLQISSERDRARVLRELMSFLKSRLGKPCIANLANIQSTMMDSMFFAHLDQGLKRELIKVKSNDEEEEGARPAKRQRTAEPAVAIKAETVDIDDQPPPSAPDAVVNGPTDAVDSPPVRIKGEVVDSEVMEISEVATKEETDSVLANVEYTYIPTAAAFWSEEGLTRLLANSMIMAGSKTLSHAQKVIDLYGQLWIDWKQYVIDRVDDEASKEISSMKASRALVTAVVDAWSHTSVSRLRLTLHQLLVARLIDPTDLFRLLSTPLEGENQSFFQTVIGDYVFWDIFDSCMGCIKSGEVLKEEIKLSDAVMADDPSRYASFFLAALNGCGEAWNRVITMNSANPGRNLSAAIQTKRIVRIMKLSGAFGEAFKAVVERVQQWNDEFPAIQATGILPKLTECAKIFHSAYDFHQTP